MEDERVNLHLPGVSGVRRDQVVSTVIEHQSSEIEEDDEGEGLVDELGENGSPHFWDEDSEFSADAAAGIFLVWICADGNGSQDVHDEVQPKHLDDVEWQVTKSQSTEEANEHEHTIDCKLELDELAHIVEHGASPFDGLLNRYEVVIHNNQVGVVFGNITSTSHTQSNISRLQSHHVSDTIASHGNQSAVLLDAMDHNEYN